MQFLTVGGQSPESEEEGTAVLEVVGYELAVGIETGAVALVRNAEQGILAVGDGAEVEV